MFLDEVGGVADDLRIEDWLAFRVVERRNRHAPGALAADAPVGPRLHRAFDAVDAPVGNPLHAVNLGERFLSEGSSRRESALIISGIGSERTHVRCYMVNLNEPLIHCAENDGRLATPA